MPNEHADVTVSREVAAPPAAVWELLADLTRMPEWSPENDRVEWTGGATGPALGARFKGRNHHGKHSWSSAGRITAFEPERRLAFAIAAGPLPVSEWGYVLEPTDGGTLVTESWTDRRNGLVKVVSKLVSGVEDRAEHNRAGMGQTLEQLAAAAEA